jgi:uncharacterized protein YacL
MSRSSVEPQRSSIPNTETGAARGLRGELSPKAFARLAWDFWVMRGVLIACTAALGYTLKPFGLGDIAATGAGFFVALLILLAELRLRRAALSGLVGGAVGTLLGFAAALLAVLVISRTAAPESTKSFLEFAFLFGFGYLGMVLGSSRGGELRADSLNEIFRANATPSTEAMKLLDTSVLIDGRIADVCEAHFLDGVLGVPQFVLHELQLVADSSDALKRQRGRRGLEVLQRMQKLAQIEVRILEQDFPQTGDVDHKLVELARRTGAKIVTNDYNLNKVATVQGVAVLNVNQLANALKPVVLPGEQMRVLILREGKEPNQGVAYLDDGTMVVIDGARKLINRSVDVIVTSVHQTPAGKMIFGRLDEKAEQNAAPMKQAAAAAGAGRGDGTGRIADVGTIEQAPRQIYPEPEA